MPFSDSSTVKSLISALAVLLAVFSFTGCGDDSETPSGPAAAGFAWDMISGTPTTGDISDIWRVTPDHLVAVTHDGTIYRWANGRWTHEYTVAYTGNWLRRYGLNAVWGSPEGDLVVVGDTGIVLTNSGAEWRLIPDMPAHDFYDVAGLSSTDLWIVGDDGTVLHGDDDDWETMTPDSAMIYTAVHVTPGGEVFVVGTHPSDYNSKLYKYSDRHWAEYAIPNSLYLGILGNVATEIYMCDIYGAVVTFDGLEVEQHFIHFGSMATDAAFLGDNRIGLLSRDGPIISFQDGIWDTLQTPIGGASALAARGGDDIVVAGSTGKFARYDGENWDSRQFGLITRVNLMDVWCSPDGQIFAAGDSGTVVHFDGHEWQQHRPAPNHRFVSVWGRSSTEVYLLSRDYWNVEPQSMVLRFDGVTFDTIWIPPTRYVQDLTGNSDGQVLVSESPAGSGYMSVHRFDGSSWSELYSVTDSCGTAYNLWSYDSTFVIGAGSDCATVYDGQDWSRIPDGQFVILCRDIWGFRPDQVVACNGFGEVALFDGSTRTNLGEPPMHDYSGIWGPAIDDLIVVANGGYISHWNGSSWVDAAKLTNQHLQKVSGFPDGSAVAVGNNGTILRLDR